MTRDEYRNCQLKHYETLTKFKFHVLSGGTLRGTLLIVLFYMSLCWPLLKIPVLGGILTSIQSLYIGYFVEIDNSVTLTRTPPTRMSPTKRELINNEVFDYLIIGSGPGAAVAAQKVKEFGSVLVLERGRHPQTNFSEHHTLQHVLHDFYKSGQEVILAKGMPMYAQASTVGGGSEVNAGLYHRLPAHLVDRYTQGAHISKETWVTSENHIRDLLNISEMRVDPEDSVIARAAKSMGMTHSNIPRWRTYNENGSFVHHGANALIWEKLIKHYDVSILEATRATYIDSSRPDYVTVRTNSTSDSVVKARKVIVCAGATATPYLLCSSHLVKWASTRFGWHPMIRTIATTNESDLGRLDIDPYQTWTSDHVLKFGSAVSTPGFLALNMQRILDSAELPYLRSYYASFASTGRGGLVPFTQTPWYRYSQSDAVNIKAATEKLREIVETGGGKIDKAMLLKNPRISSVHIFGSLPVDSGEFEEGTVMLKGDNRIQVCDASLLPTGPGVNPQAIVMSLVQSLVCS